MSRLSFYSKKTVAWICAIALVVAGLVGYQANTVKAASGVDWSTVDYAGDGAGGGAYNNLYKFYSVDGNGSLVNIQMPGFASEAGMYVTFPMGITSCSVSSDIQGAGIILHLSAFTAKETQVIVASGTTEWECWVYYENGTEGGDEGGEVETTTQAPKAPNAPEGLVANINDLGTNYTIAFASVAGATSYKLYVDGTYLKDITNGGIVTFDEAGLAAGTTYTFGVSAVNAVGESSISTVQVTTPGTNSGVEVSNDVMINGFQMSTNTLTVGGSTYDGGVRTIYSVEPTVDGQNVAEVGLVYGVTAKITDADMVIDSESEYVASAVATAAGELSKVYGTSTTATYYAMTMADDLANASVAELQGSYSVRAYAKLADGTYVYSDVATFSKYGVASYLYDNALFSTYTAHAYVYDNVLSRVNASYPEVDYVWSQTIVKPNDLED